MDTTNNNFDSQLEEAINASLQNVSNFDNKFEEDIAKTIELSKREYENRLFPIWRN